MTRSTGLLAGALVVVLTVGAAVFFILRRPQPAPTKPAGPQIVIPPPAPAEVTLQGRIQAAKVINVGVPIDGTIEQFLAEIGDDVSQGEVLARIRNPKLATAQDSAQAEAERTRTRVAELEASLLSARLEVSRSDADATRAKLELDKAGKEYERQKLLFSEGITARLVFEKSEQDYNTLKTQVQTMAETSKKASERVASLNKELAVSQQLLERRTTAFQDAQLERSSGEVDAPADGVVISRRGEVNRPVTRSVTDLFQIAVDLETLQAIVSPDAQTLRRIHPGEIAVVEIAETQSTAQGKVTEVKPGEVVIEFASPSPSIRPAMAARVTIKLS